MLEKLPEVTGLRKWPLTKCQGLYRMNFSKSFREGLSSENEPPVPTPHYASYTYSVGFILIF